MTMWPCITHSCGIRTRMQVCDDAICIIEAISDEIRWLIVEEWIMFGTHILEF
jgi:hypothetical protein